jgi:hypothetical protein
VGPLDPAARKAAQQQFMETTGVPLKIEELPPLPANALAPPADAPRLDQFTTSGRIREALGPESGLYKIGAHPAQGLLTLRFHFPAMVAARYGQVLAGLAAETGWFLEIDPHPHQGMLEAAARESCPPSVMLAGPPAIRETVQEVALLYCSSLEADAEETGAARETAARAFQERTGWRLAWLRAKPMAQRETATGDNQPAGSTGDFPPA